MIPPALAFSLAGNLALLGWLALLVSLFAPTIRRPVWIATGLAIPAILACTYILLLWQGRDAFAEGGFGSIAQVRILFANGSTLTAGWLHYLAFDLFVGTWIARDGIERRMPRLLILPSLPLTFMFGPAGLLLHLVLRLASRPHKQETDQ